MDRPKQVTTIDDLLIHEAVKFNGYPDDIYALRDDNEVHLYIPVQSDSNTAVKYLGTYPAHFFFVDARNKLHISQVEMGDQI